MKAIIEIINYERTSKCNILGVGSNEDEARRRATLTVADRFNNDPYQYIESIDEVPPYKGGAVMEFVPYNKELLIIEIFKTHFVETEFSTLKYNVKNEPRNRIDSFDGVVVSVPVISIEYFIKLKDGVFGRRKDSGRSGSHLIETYFMEITENTIYKAVSEIIADFESREFKDSRIKKIEDMLGYVNDDGIDYT